MPVGLRSRKSRDQASSPRPLDSVLKFNNAIQGATGASWRCERETVERRQGWWLGDAATVDGAGRRGAKS
ncbi:hypothetical protein NL676_033114 [Syzygium grande]|nr:hypothetical protein NL676_033114 [Syzygium grande]